MGRIAWVRRRGLRAALRTLFGGETVVFRAEGGGYSTSIEPGSWSPEVDLPSDRALGMISDLADLQRTGLLPERPPIDDPDGGRRGD